jgi:hypothetical protein
LILEDLSKCINSFKFYLKSETINNLHKITYVPAHITSKIHAQLNTERFFNNGLRTAEKMASSATAAKCHPPIKIVVLINILRTVTN